MCIKQMFFKLSLWLRLCRFDKPAGIVLLWVPTACALWLANAGKPAWELVAIFFMGTVLMRAAGCIINDLADLPFDASVQRTRVRPLVSGAISIKEAFVVLGFLLLGACCLLCFLPLACLYYALIAITVTIIYPFCKRWIHAPQSILGIAFSMGIPMAYVASGTPFDGVFIVLCLLNYLWIIAYDTEYAMVDREDDQRIGIRSTAIWFADWDVSIIMALLIVQHLLWLVIGWQVGWTLSFLCLWALAWVGIFYQWQLVRTRQRDKCWQAFLCNNWYGLWMWVGVFTLFVKVGAG